MTPLQQRFLDAIEENSLYRDSEMGIEVKFDRSATACQKIAEEFAIGFAEWIELKSGFKRAGYLHEPLRWIKFEHILKDNPPTFTTAQLIPQFKEQGK